VTSFCNFCIVEHRVSKMTFHHNVKKNLFYISINIPAFFRFIGWPEGPETDIVTSSDSVSVITSLFYISYMEPVFVVTNS